MMTFSQTEYHLGPLSEIPPGEGREFDIQGQQIAVFHTRAGGVYATQAFCPHRQGPLIDGLIGGTTLMCPLHGRKFDLQTGAPVQAECGIEVYPVRVANGEIVLSVAPADAEAQTEIPRDAARLSIDQTPIGSHVGPPAST